MKLKHIMRGIFKALLALIVLVFAYLVYVIAWISRFNADQRAVAADVAADFAQTMPILRDPNGCFGTVALINGRYADTLLFDTQASTSLAKQETLDRYGAEYWRRKPMPTFNFYRQAYFSKLYRVGDIRIGGCILKGAAFTSVPKDNGMYNALYRTVLGRTVMESLVWKFDMDERLMTVLSPENAQALARETEGYARIENGINSLALHSAETDTLDMMLDLGSNYDVIIDRTAYERLLRRRTPKRYVNLRRAGLTDTIAEFSGITIRCHGVTVPDCTLDYIPTIDRNVAGNIFAGKMNFILAGEDLYVRQRAGGADKCSGRLAPLGLNVNIRNGVACVTSLEIGGPAEKAGIRLGDKVTAVDNGAVAADIMSVSSGRLEEYIRQAESLVLDIERDGQRQTVVIAGGK